MRVLVKSVQRSISAAVVVASCLVVSGCASTNAQVSRNAVVIKDSYGGSVNSTFAKYREWARAGKRIIIDGRVHSADAFAAFSMPNACYTKNAIFSPHAAATLGIVPNYDMTNRLTRGLPPELAEEFRNSGSYYNWVTTARFTYDDLKKIWPNGEC